MVPTILFLKLLLGHLVADFILQPICTANYRNTRLKYLHPFIHTALVSVLIGCLLGRFQDYGVVLFIFLCYSCLELSWKLFPRTAIKRFIISQVFHLFVLGLCGVYLVYGWEGFCFKSVSVAFDRFFENKKIVVLSVGYLTVIWPARMLLNYVMQSWYEKIKDSLGDDYLENAGAWIGICERVIALTFVLYDQFAAIGLLITAKSILRFREGSTRGAHDKLRSQTEYVLIGTLMSFGIAILAGIAVKTIL